MTQAQAKEFLEKYTSVVYSQEAIDALISVSIDDVKFNEGSSIVSECPAEWDNLYGGEKAGNRPCKIKQGTKEVYGNLAVIYSPVRNSTVQEVSGAISGPGITGDIRFYSYREKTGESDWTEWRTAI